MKHEIFKRDNNYVRHDYGWVGFGWRYDYDQRYGLAHTFWINRYRRCPRLLSALLSPVNHCGLIAKGHAHRSRLATYGSWVKPWESYSVRCGRVFVGGDTPGFVKKLLNWRCNRKMAKMAEDYPWEDQQ